MKTALIGAATLMLALTGAAHAQVDVTIPMPSDNTVMHAGDVTTVEVVWDFALARPALANIRFRLWQGATLLSTSGLGIACGWMQTLVHPPNWAMRGTYKDVQTCSVGPIPAWAQGKTLTIDADGADVLGNYDAAPTTHILFQ